MSTMNGFIRRDFDERRGVSPTTDRAAELQEAQQELERAVQAGDDLRAQQANTRIDAIVTAAREAQTPPTPPPADFDAGARRAVQRPPTMNDLIRNTYLRR